MTDFEKDIDSAQCKREWTNALLKIVCFPLMVLGAPICFLAFCQEHIKQWVKEKQRTRLQFSNEACKQCLDKVLPEIVAYLRDISDVSASTILISSSEDMGLITFSDLLAWTRNHHRKAYEFFLKFRKEIGEYILNEYTVEGYQKISITNWTHWEKACKRFEWHIPYDNDTAKGVIFYKEEAFPSADVING